MPRQACRVCGCTENDCRQCIESTGEPCHWVEPNLCSACEDFAKDSGVGNELIAYERIVRILAPLGPDSIQLHPAEVVMGVRMLRRAFDLVTLPSESQLRASNIRHKLLAEFGQEAGDVMSRLAGKEVSRG